MTLLFDHPGFWIQNKQSNNASKISFRIELKLMLQTQLYSYQIRQMINKAQNKVLMRTEAQYWFGVRNIDGMLSHNLLVATIRQSPVSLLFTWMIHLCLGEKCFDLFQNLSDWIELFQRLGPQSNQPYRRKRFESPDRFAISVSCLLIFHPYLLVANFMTNLVRNHVRSEIWLSIRFIQGGAMQWKRNVITSYPKLDTWLFIRILADDLKTYINHRFKSPFTFNPIIWRYWSLARI